MCSGIMHSSCTHWVDHCNVPVHSVLNRMCVLPAGHVPVECAISITNIGNVGLSDFRLLAGAPAEYTGLACADTTVLNENGTRTCTLTRTVNQVRTCWGHCRMCILLFGAVSTGHQLRAVAPTAHGTVLAQRSSTATNAKARASRAALQQGC